MKASVPGISALVGDVDVHQVDVLGSHALLERLRGHTVPAVAAPGALVRGAVPPHDASPALSSVATASTIQIFQFIVRSSSNGLSRGTRSTDGSRHSRACGGTRHNGTGRAGRPRATGSPPRPARSRCRGQQRTAGVDPDPRHRSAAPPPAGRRRCGSACSAPVGHCATTSATCAGSAPSSRIHGRALASNTSGALRRHSAAWVHSLGSQVTTIPSPSYRRAASGR